MNGTIFNIEHYAIHDGPGIRTTVFFKGCPLACLWCHNPEGLSVKPQIVYYRQRCVGCKKCVSLCAAGALSPRDGGISLDAGKCRLCGRCAENCPAEALEKVGRSVTAAEVVAEAEKDRIFYEESGGGVTFSGGEPFLQADFLRECLTLAKTQGLHTAVETSGFAPREAVEKAAPYVDLFLFDVKHIRAAEHERGGLGFGRVDFLQEFPVRVVVHNAAPVPLRGPDAALRVHRHAVGDSLRVGHFDEIALVGTAPVSIS